MKIKCVISYITVSFTTADVVKWCSEELTQSSSSTGTHMCIPVHFLVNCTPLNFYFSMEN